MSSRTAPSPSPDACVVLFDGVCNLCNRSVQFLLDHDPAGRLRFAAQQSDAGQALLRRVGRPAGAGDTMLFLERGRLYDRSTAALRVTRYLRQPWPLLAILLVVPRPVRDWAYDRLALNRYALFGRSATCRVPGPATAGRFLS